MAQPAIPRRSFLKYGVLGGLAAWGAASALTYPAGWQRWMEYGHKPWEVDLGVVDYDRVPDREGTMSVVPRFYLDDPARRVLNVAQWYDYWPGSVVNDFGTYMQERYGLPGCQVRWTSNIYTSNEELFTWVTQTGRKFDVMVPTNYTVETMEKAGLIVNLKKEWLPNYKCMFGTVPADMSDIEPWRIQFYEVPTYPTRPDGYNNHAGYDFRDPTLNGYQYRSNSTTYESPRGTDVFTWDEQNSLVAVPYQWGTTGIGYRSDVFTRADIERYGWDIFKLTEYRNPDTGRTYNLNKKKMMLDDMRETFTAALKAVGWQKQEELRAQGLTDAPPTAIAGNTGPTGTSMPATYAEAPFNGEFQWSNNEETNDKLQAAQDWLLSWVGGAWGFNTPQQGPWLVSKQMLVDQAWSGDIMYAVRPNSSQFLPVDYVVPKQGGARWIDNMVIHRESEKLWLAHQFINYIHDPLVQADISEWNLYASPNAWSFELLDKDATYHFIGRYPETYPDPTLAGQTYNWKPTADHRIYSDFAKGQFGTPSADGTYPGPPILDRCEYQKDVGVRDNLNYFKFWRRVKF